MGSSRSAIPRFGEWQQCPICAGSGQVFAPMSTSTQRCHACLGAGLVARPVLDDTEGGVGRSSEYVGPLGDYIAVNLREALQVIPDTGDWYAIVLGACDRALKDGTNLRPNQSEEWYRERICETANLGQAGSSSL